MYVLDHEPERARRPWVLLGAGVLAAALQTGAFALAARLEPAAAPAPKPEQTVALSFVELPPPPPPPGPELPPPPAPAVAEVAPPEPKPLPKPRPKPRPKPAPAPRPAPAVVEAPSPEPAPSPAEPPKPRLLTGLTLESTVQGGGPRFGLGDTAHGTPDRVGGTPGGRGRGAAGQPEGEPGGSGAAAPARTAAQLQKKAVPDYPAAARREGIEGTVVLSIVIDEQGRVVRATVVQGLGHGLDEAAVAAAKATLWHPATVAGRPVQSTRRFDVRFTLEV